MEKQKHKLLVLLFSTSENIHASSQLQGYNLVVYKTFSLLSVLPSSRGKQPCREFLIQWRKPWVGLPPCEWLKCFSFLSNFQTLLASRNSVYESTVHLFWIGVLPSAVTNWEVLLKCFTVGQPFRWKSTVRSYVALSGGRKSRSNKSNAN